VPLSIPASRSIGVVEFSPTINVAVVARMVAPICSNFEERTDINTVFRLGDASVDRISSFMPEVMDLKYNILPWDNISHTQYHPSTPLPSNSHYGRCNSLHGYIYKLVYDTSDPRQYSARTLHIPHTASHATQPVCNVHSLGTASSTPSQRNAT